MQMKTPRFQLAHRGSAIVSAGSPARGYHDARLFRLQSEHVLLPSSFTRFLRVARFCSARSAAGLGRRDMVGCGRVRREWRVVGMACGAIRGGAEDVDFYHSKAIVCVRVRLVVEIGAACW